MPPINTLKEKRNLQETKNKKYNCKHPSSSFGRRPTKHSARLYPAENALTGGIYLCGQCVKQTKSIGNIDFKTMVMLKSKSMGFKIRRQKSLNLPIFENR